MQNAATVLGVLRERGRLNANAHAVVTGEPGTRKRVRPVRREATRKRTSPWLAPRCVADPTQTLKKWLRGQPAQPATITALQTLIDAFVAEYNHRRPHRSLPQHATPATAYQTRPKAEPGNHTTAETHDRLRHDRIDKAGKITLRYNGQLYSIGVGRTHTRTHVLVLVQDLNIRIIDAATGELLRELVLDPTRRYQPTRRPPGPPQK